MSEPLPGAREASRRRFLVAAAVLPVVAATPFIIHETRAPSSQTAGDRLEVRLTSNDGRYQALADKPVPRRGKADHD